MIYCEEKINGITPEGTATIARGKVNWFDIETIKRDAPAFAYLFKNKPEPEDLDKLANYLVLFLKSKGFVFFASCYYRYKVNTSGYLKEFGVNFHHIK